MTTPLGAGGGAPTPSTGSLDLVIARILSIGVYSSLGFLLVGVGLMVTNGISPLDSAWPSFDASTIPSGLAALEPAAYIWVGLVLAVLTPSARVAASFVGYLRTGERGMALISLAILAVIAISILVAAAVGG